MDSGKVKLNQFEIVQVGYLSCFYNNESGSQGGTKTESEAHGLGYTPAFDAYLLSFIDTSYRGLPYHEFDADGNQLERSISFSVDDTNINLTTSAPTGSSYYLAKWNTQVKYYLLRETADVST